MKQYRDRPKEKTALAVLFLTSVFFLSGCSSFLEMIPEAENCSADGKCREGFACDTDGKCHVCGNAEFRVCCEVNKCEEGMVCVDKKCRLCGKTWQHCCEGGKCDQGFYCDEDGKCKEYGVAGELCLENGTCKNEYLYCDDGGRCRQTFQPGLEKEVPDGGASRG